MRGLSGEARSCYWAIQRLSSNRAPARATFSYRQVKQHLAAIRMLYDWLIIGQVSAINPAHAVRGPKHVVTKGLTPVLDDDEMVQLLNGIDTSDVVGLRDRALIGMMVYTFGRVGAVTAMNVRDYFPQGKRWHVRLHEKGGKEHEMPVHSVLEKYLDEYLQAAGIGEEKNTPLFRTAFRKTKRLTENRIHEHNVQDMTKKRARQAGIATPITNHSFRATGITNYLRNGGTREKAQQMANHSSARTTQLYDRREDEVTVQEIEKVRFERIDVDVRGF